ncbi:MAG TPA: tetratricopeptide repeat protein, partial [Bacteroidales bacterium]|nr:tetratricopeptide repeat protein [Bacteroidales bacterium]
MNTSIFHSINRISAYCKLKMPVLLLLLFFVAAETTAQSDSLSKLQLSGEDFGNKPPESLEDYLFLSKTFLSKTPEKSYTLSLMGIKVAKQHANTNGLALAYKSAGVAAYTLSLQKVAGLYYDSALAVFTQLADTVEMAKVLNNIGVLYVNFGQYVKAVDYYNKALQLNILIDNKESIGKINNNIGALYLHLGSYEQAASYFSNAYELAKSLGDKASMLSIQNNLGLIRLDEGKYAEAGRLFKECVSIAEETGDFGGKGNALQNLGNLYLQQQRADSAFYFLNLTLQLFDELKKPVSRTWYAIGKTHLLNQNHRQALNAFLKAEEDLQFYPDGEMRILVLKELYKSWDYLGNTKEAFKVLKLYHQVFDSVKDLFDSTAVANLEARFAMDQKLEEVETLKTEKVIQEKILIQQKETNETNRKLLIITLLILVILFISLVLYFSMYKKHKKLNTLLTEQNTLLENAKNELDKSQKLYAEQEERLMLLINAMPDIICFKDGLGRWVIANQADLELFALDNVDYKGKTDIDLIPCSPSNEMAFRACVVSDEEAWQQRKMIRSDEIITDPAGNDRVYDVIKMPLFHADGKRRALIVIGRDITERKQTEIQLTAALQKAEESERLKSAFLSNMSHEIRTPLNAVIGFSELLEAGNLSEEKLSTFVRHIKDNGNALQTLIADILELSRIESGSIQINEETVNLGNLFTSFYEEFLRLAQARGKQNLAIKIQVPTGEQLFISDKQRIRQVMTNLFDNALKFTGEGSISYGFKVVRNQANEPLIHLYMTDTGIGIPETKKHLLFKRFTKIHEGSGMVYPGAGLGLSIVEQIVKLMNGNINIHSEAGYGTTVNIFLPATFGTPENQRVLQDDQMTV